MNKKITFRHMEHSVVIENYVNQQLEKIENFLKDQRVPVFIDVVLTAAKNHSHDFVEVKVKTAKFDLFTHHEAPKMYDAIDKAIDRMYHELKKAKERFIEDEQNKDSYKGA